MASDGSKIIPSVPLPFPLNDLREMRKSSESVEPESMLPVSCDGQPSNAATNEHQMIESEPVTRGLSLPLGNNGGSNGDGAMVNLDVLSQRSGRQLESSTLLGIYDVKVKFIHSSEDPVNYKLDLIEGEKNGDEEEATIPSQYRERASNWKFEVRKRLQNGRIEKFYYQEGVRKTYRSIKKVKSYILQGVVHTSRRPPIKRKGEASSSKGEKKLEEEEVAEKEYSSMKEFYEECYNNLQNFLDDKEGKGHASSSINKNIGEKNQQTDALEVEGFLAKSYNNLLHYFD